MICCSDLGRGRNYWYNLYFQADAEGSGLNWRDRRKHRQAKQNRKLSYSISSSSSTVVVVSAVATTVSQLILKKSIAGSMQFCWLKFVLVTVVSFEYINVWSMQCIRLLTGARGFRVVFDVGDLRLEHGVDRHLLTEHRRDDGHGRHLTRRDGGKLGHHLHFCHSRHARCKWKG